MAGAFLTDDLAAFFDIDEFADAATFDGASVQVTGILDAAYDLSMLGVVEVCGTAPVFFLVASDVPANVQGRHLRFGSLLANGSRYRVREVRPDGTGVTALVLELSA